MAIATHNYSSSWSNKIKCNEAHLPIKHNLVLLLDSPITTGTWLDGIPNCSIIINIPPYSHQNVTIITNFGPYMVIKMIITKFLLQFCTSYVSIQCIISHYEIFSRHLFRHPNRTIITNHTHVVSTVCANYFIASSLSSHHHHQHKNRKLYIVSAGHLIIRSFAGNIHTFHN